MNAHTALLIVGLGLLSVAATARAERYRSFDGYEVHHNAMRADFITPQTANTHGLTRSGARGLVNIAVLHRNEDGSKRPVEATLTVTVSNLAGQSQAVAMKAVREPGAIYYVGEFRISGIDTYRFEVDVQPDGSERRYALRFTQELVADR